MSSVDLGAYAPEERYLVAALFPAEPTDPVQTARVDRVARRLVEAIRARSGVGSVEELLRQYALDSREGLALMILAETLLRVPDAATADRLIEDKLGAVEFGPARPDASLLVGASAWSLGLSSRIVRQDETPDTVLAGLVRRIGLPAVRTMARAAMRLLGQHFVLGQTIEEALRRARSGAGRLYRYSFDMLGEGARTAEDAHRYRQSYAEAIEAIGRRAAGRLSERPGISVKFSALHPGYEAVNRERVVAELVPIVLELARAARRHELNFTVDAEEQDRLELSLAVIAAVAEDPTLANWDGFGFAVQAYGKRALAVIDHAFALARRFDRRFMIRLVKGAYWDTEIKRAQERGLDDYPVYTSKHATDLSFMACAERLLAARPLLYPQFATHNALTAACLLDIAGHSRNFEFQRLHGMGDALYAAVLRDHPDVAVRTYAPVGGHAELLAYLVRRLLENGANSSFVSLAADPTVPVERLLTRPHEQLADPLPAFVRPPNLYGDRRNSRGVELGHAASLRELLASMRSASAAASSTPLAPEAAMTDAIAAFPQWNRTPVADRASILERASDLLEARRGMFLSLLAQEGGKTLDDGVAELREAVDFLRYYAAEARKLFVPVSLPGPTGETNTLHRHGRGVWLCISPWNFPLAIFIGQVAAALAAGNAVVAKPAPQTPRVAALAIGLLHEAGVPVPVLRLVPADREVGASLVSHPSVAGVVFTGSTRTASTINQALAARQGPIVPLIAETGGINAMIVDATALPEQITDDVVTSAFRSAGQRCSALRLLCVQEELAERLVSMIAGACAELRIGDPTDPAMQIGPVIDGAAKNRLAEHIARMSVQAQPRYAGVPPEGCFVAPHVFELGRAADLKEEVFGPILHIVRWRADTLESLLNDLAANGYGLTAGVHSRNDGFVQRVLDRLSGGNIYVNRSMIGAVVGTQPFGGHGLSGTGPKAGGPDYLRRFAVERVVTINTAAAGGNAALLAQPTVT